ncbi:hypothetical protein PAXRUDRAFT_35590 [Paxillus rubicundulus Ve08.2h10]|uniref:DDE-1 domain-containing protein n=1 Tax=Paxillus rubicundulus Ve08.2h10 TaxID=930991 RepID=A0A0D0CI10_9AGAM|nr:hypothetical protein PAXRUDRAFT_35590 [Paxillus rubicundulus Ve08.2h10]
MGRKAGKLAAAHARAARHTQQLAVQVNQQTSSSPANLPVDDDDDCGYDESGSDLDSNSFDDGESVVELEGEELEENLIGLQEELEALQKKTPYEQLLAANTGSSSAKQWKKAESQRSLGYNGTSLRTCQRYAKAAREQQQNRQAAKIVEDPWVFMMQNWLAEKISIPGDSGAGPSVTNVSNKPPPNIPADPTTTLSASELDIKIISYISDLSTDCGDDSGTESKFECDTQAGEGSLSAGQSLQPGVPPLKCQKLTVPYPKQARTIQGHLALMVRDGRKFIDASQHAAETHGFAMCWGGRQLHSWTRTWVASRDLLNDPSIATECRAYLRSHKWAMDPEKLSQFTSGGLIESAVSKYVQHLVHDEMPKGLKQYLEMELFPHIHMKVARGVSLSTAPQANNDNAKSWVLKDEYRLKKKGVGHGIHQSNVICSTVGHLEDAGQSMEYGKNHKGHWTGEHFVNQLRNKIIPAFEHAHGAGYQALFLVDNSQGHSAYAEDALVISRMNIKLGGKQACMCNS